MAYDQFTRSLPMMLYRTLDAIMPRFRRIFSEFDLTEQQWRVLRVLWESGRSTIGELSEVTLLPAPSLVGIVDRLEQRGLVARRRSEEDRRKVFVLVTAEGAELEAQIMPLVASAYADLKQSVDVDTWAAVLAGLRQIVVEGRVKRSE